MHYAVGDVHGCYDEMISMLNRIEARDPAAEFIFVGDFVDRGPQVMKTLHWAMENITENGKYQSVLGNHEDMIMEWYPHFVIAYETGGEIPETYYDFKETAEEEGILEPEALEPVIGFFQNLPLKKDRFINGIHFVIAHAWKPEVFTLDKRNAYLWARKNHYHGPEVIVHGHTPTIVNEFYGKGHRAGRIVYGKNSINVDGGCCFRERRTEDICHLCAVCLETLEEFYEPDDLSGENTGVKGREEKAEINAGSFRKKDIKAALSGKKTRQKSQGPMSDYLDRKYRADILAQMKKQ